MKKIIFILMVSSLFMGFAPVPKELRSEYGLTNPCDHPALQYTMDDIKILDDVGLNLYNMQKDKCNSYKYALMDFEEKEYTKAKTYRILRKVFLYVGIAGLYILLQ